MVALEVGMGMSGRSANVTNSWHGDREYRSGATFGIFTERKSVEEQGIPYAVTPTWFSLKLRVSDREKGNRLSSKPHSGTLWWGYDGRLSTPQLRELTDLDDRSSTSNHYRVSLAVQVHTLGFYGRSPHYQVGGPLLYHAMGRLLLSPIQTHPDSSMRDDDEYRARGG